MHAYLNSHSSYTHKGSFSVNFLCHMSSDMPKLTKWHVHPAKTLISLGIRLGSLISVFVVGVNEAKV